MTWIQNSCDMKSAVWGKNNWKNAVIKSNKKNLKKKSKIKNKKQKLEYQ